MQMDGNETRQAFVSCLFGFGGQLRREHERDSVCNGNDLWSVADAMPMHVYADAAVAMVKVKMKYIEWYMNMNLRCAAIAIYIETCACVDETAAANYS